MPHLQTPGLDVHYETAGRGRTVAVLVHGNFASWRWWKPVLERTPAGMTVHAPTLRGFGDTRGPGPARSVDELAQDLRAFVRGLGLGRFHLVGHSLGGAVALQYALTWPESLASVGLIAPAPGDGLASMRARPDLLGMMMRWTDPMWWSSRPMLSTALQMGRITGAYQGQIARALAKMMPTADRDAVDFPALLEDALALDQTVVLDIYEALRRWDVRPLLPRVAAPVRILAGERDELVSLDALRALAAGLPSAELEVWDVGHSPQLEAPAAFAAWLGRLVPSRLARMRIAWRRLAAALRGLVRVRRRPALPPAV